MVQFPFVEDAAPGDGGETSSDKAKGATTCSTIDWGGQLGSEWPGVVSRAHKPTRYAELSLVLCAACYCKVELPDFKNATARNSPRCW